MRKTSPKKQLSVQILMEEIQLEVLEIIEIEQSETFFNMEFFNNFGPSDVSVES